jgi:methionyl-tRNA synthetase
MVNIDEFRKFEFRVAEVLEVTPHPQADRLWVLDIRVGEETKRIVAGIKLFYAPEELKGKKVIVVNNLEPAVIRGVESQGMLLAAQDGQNLSIIVPERDVASGATVK